jgi:hypothetical protein
MGLHDSASPQLNTVTIYFLPFLPTNKTNPRTTALLKFSVPFRFFFLFRQIVQSQMGKKSKSSRKGKKEWRTNISTEEIEDFFEKSTKDALSGGSVQALESHSLFFEDKSKGTNYYYCCHF